MTIQLEENVENSIIRKIPRYVGAAVGAGMLALGTINYAGAEENLTSPPTVEETTTEPTQDIISLLDGLSSDRARAKFVEILVGKTEISEKYLEQAIATFMRDGRGAAAAGIAENISLERVFEVYEGMGDYDSAGYLAQRKGMIERAAAYYEEGNEFFRAAGMYEKNGMPDKAKKYWLLAMDDSESKGHFKDAGWAASKAGLREKAKVFYTKASEQFEAEGAYLFAADMAEEAGLIDRVEGLNTSALEFFEENKDYIYAGEAAERLGLTERAVENHVKANRPNTAIRTAEEAGRIDLALDVLEQYGAYRTAMELADTHNMPEKIEFYRNLLDFQSWLNNQKNG